MNAFGGFSRLADAAEDDILGKGVVPELFGIFQQLPHFRGEVFQGLGVFLSDGVDFRQDFVHHDGDPVLGDGRLEADAFVLVEDGGGVVEDCRPGLLSEPVCPSCGGEAEREEVSVAQEEAGGGLPPFPEEEEEGVPAIVELVPEGLPVLADSEDAGEILVDSL